MASKSGLIFMILLFSASVYAEGPLFRHKDPTVNQEFENAYQSIRETNDRFSFTLDNPGLTLTQDGDGDVWLTANAYYDGEFWQRVSTANYSFGLELIATGNFPGEAEPGAAMWRVSPGANPISNSFGVVGGWELGWDLTAFRDFVVGGRTIEMDGAGLTPFGRFIHSDATGPERTGILTNIFGDFGGADDENKGAWFIGREDDTFVVKRSTYGAEAGLEEYVHVSTYGVSQAKQTSFLAYNSSTDSNVTGQAEVVTVDFDTEVYDINSDFASDTFTAPITGKYLLSSGVTIKDGTGPLSCEMRLVTSNRTYAQELTSNIDRSHYSITVIADMDTSDTASAAITCSGGLGSNVDILGTGGTTSGVGEPTFFSGSLLN